MAVILPFRGLRYNTTADLDLAMVTAPPYDCITPQQQDDLYDAHPYNIVRLILGRQSARDDDGVNQYTRAAALLKEWVDKGVLIREQRPALYLYEQEFTSGGRTAVRRGFVGRVVLEEFGGGSIFPHEETFAAAREDRLRLLKATSCNLSQVLALYADAGNEVMGVFDRFALATPDLLVVDDAGIVNRMWIVTDESAAAEVTELMHRRPLILADGHHRYLTALAYRRSLIEQGEKVTEHHPANTTSIMCVSTGDPGLAILPNHRVLTRLPQTSAAEIHDLLKSHFTWRKFVGAEATSGRMADHMAGKAKAAFGVYIRGDQAAYVATLRNGRAMDEVAPNHSAAWRRLDVAVLHGLVFKRLLAPRFGDADKLGIRYLPRATEAFDAVHEDGASLAFLVRPTKVSQVEAIAGSGELLPQKSTHFYPKLLSGLVMNPLDQG
jgi:uncharacterized protein (DUF1015 family)